MMNFRKNKKAQVYILFVALFTVIALTYALVSLNDAKKITGSDGKDMIIGTKQAQVFSAIQDGDSINLYLQKAAELSASSALTSLQQSCFINIGKEETGDPQESPCGKYVYPQWSNAEKVCLPNCYDTFVDAFSQSLSSRLNSFYKETRVSIPSNYHININLGENSFVVSGKSSSVAQFKVLDMEERPTETLDEQKGYLASQPVAGETGDSGIIQGDNFCVASQGTKSQEETARIYGATVKRASATYGISECLIFGYLYTESAGDPCAVSSTGAVGLMQMFPAAASDVGLSVIGPQASNDPRFDPTTSIIKGTAYIRKVHDYMNYGECSYYKCSYQCTSCGSSCDSTCGSTCSNCLRDYNYYDENVIRAYNAGSGAVTKNLIEGKPLSQEARDYPGKVLKYAAEFKSKGLCSDGSTATTGGVIMSSETGQNANIASADTSMTGNVISTNQTANQTVTSQDDQDLDENDNPNLGLLSWPLPEGNNILTSCFGRRIADGTSDHPAIDIGGNMGDPVLAAANGYMTLTDPCWGRVIISHEQGLMTEYLHMDSILVHEGDEVEKGQQIGTLGGRKCVDERNRVSYRTAYPFHLHFGVIYENADTYLRYTKPFVISGVKTVPRKLASGEVISNKFVVTERYSYQYMTINSFYAPHINPLCFIDQSDYVKKQQNNDECFTPINSEIDDSCAMYDMYDFEEEANAMAKRLYPANPENAPVAYSDTITGYASVETPPETANSEQGQAENSAAKSSNTPVASINSDFGTYSFNPSFSVPVYKKIDNPLEPVTIWFEETWNECQDDPQNCIGTKVSEFNKKAENDANAKFTLHPVEECEASPYVSLFYDFMESIEDCFSNGKYSCSCSFDFSKASASRKDLTIKFELDTGKIFLYAKEADGSMKQIGDPYTLYYGVIKPAMGDQKYFYYRLEFDDKTGKFQSATLTPSKEEAPDSSTYVFNNYNVAKITKTSQAEGQFVDNDDAAECVYSKDKFRLCAKPKPGNPELSLVKFALQLKDKAPPAITSGDVKIIETDESSSKDADNIMSLAGILGMIYPPLGFLFNLASILEALDDFKPRSMEVMVNMPLDKDGKPLDIAGYEVYCNDYLTDLLPKEYIEKFKPSNFVVMANQQINAINAKTTSQLDRYVNTNSYADFLNKIDCDVPVSKADGQTVMVPAIKGSVKDDKMVFNLKSCGEFAIIADKILKKNYCITLIPVDKNGNKLVENTISNCAQTNSLMDMAIDELIKRELGDFIPVDLVPKDLQPYIKLPTSSDLVDAAMGTRDFNLVSIVDADKLTGDLKDYAGSFIVETVNKEILGNSFAQSLDELNLWDKQAVISELSREIKDEDAKILFNSFVSGQNMDVAVKQAAYSKGIDYIDQSKAPEILKELAKGENPESLAYEKLIEAAQKEMTSDQKKAVLLEIAKSGNAQEAADKLIEKAVEKGCAENYGISVDQAVACLRDDEITAVYDEMISDMQTPEAAKQALLNKAIDEMGDKAPDVLKTVILQQNFQGAALQMIESELNKMDDSQKKQFIMDALDGKMPDASAIQQELVTMIPALNNSYITTLMQNGNVKNLLESTLKEELQNQLDSFISGECVPVNKEVVGNI